MDNVNKRGMSKLVECQFCGEEESIAHLFFECCVAKAISSYVTGFLGMQIGLDYISVAVKWLSAEKYYIINVISSVVIRGLLLFARESDRSRKPLFEIGKTRPSSFVDSDSSHGRHRHSAIKLLLWPSDVWTKDRQEPRQL
jgi:hypothetical protein